MPAAQTSALNQPAAKKEYPWSQSNQAQEKKQYPWAQNQNAAGAGQAAQQAKPAVEEEDNNPIMGPGGASHFNMMNRN